MLVSGYAVIAWCSSSQVVSLRVHCCGLKVSLTVPGSSIRVYPGVLNLQGGCSVVGPGLLVATAPLNFRHLVGMPQHPELLASALF
eukprot:scaffold310025_cov22-Tisochrysis_lutea.AAC.1